MIVLGQSFYGLQPTFDIVEWSRCLPQRLFKRFREVVPMNGNDNSSTGGLDYLPPILLREPIALLAKFTDA